MFLALVCCKCSSCRMTVLGPVAAIRASLVVVPCSCDTLDLAIRFAIVFPLLRLVGCLALGFATTVLNYILGAMFVCADLALVADRILLGQRRAGLHIRIRILVLVLVVVWWQFLKLL